MKEIKNMRVKEWFSDKMMSEVTRYGDMWMNLDQARDPENHDMVKVDEEGFVTFTCRCEILKETEKALQIRLGDSWTQWFPKSVIEA